MKIGWRTLLLIVFVSNYAGVSLFCFLGHDHEPDLQFHDHCPACQWEVQSQEDFYELNAILDALIDPLVIVDQSPIVQSLILPKHQFQTTHFSRAPPPSA